MTWKLFTFSFFILTIYSKLTIFLHRVLWTQKYKIFTFWWGGWEFSSPLSVFRCSVSLLQMCNQSSSNVQSVFFKCAINPLQISTSASLRFYSCFYDDIPLLLGWFTPTFRMRRFNIDWIPMDIALNLFLTLIEALPCREYKIFRPRK